MHRMPPIGHLVGHSGCHVPCPLSSSIYLYCSSCLEVHWSARGGCDQRFAVDFMQSPHHFLITYFNSAVQEFQQSSGGFQTTGKNINGFTVSLYYRYMFIMPFIVFKRVNSRYHHWIEIIQKSNSNRNRSDGLNRYLDGRLM